ncbi:hypothetical protein STPYR_10801 [uncultured Stenotrophomonas sp.]|uniref:Uncharacterized protein n=1 Tax=uncultured Stenotrophomonas sp. TaxID=165438 RepID=A0A1Y5Q0U6_9GAMM|nr:hypothetical protein STPYR_10801 [uncultured Stenotrophomonas sp.]
MTAAALRLLRRGAPFPAYFSATASWPSVAVISTAVLQSSALAILKMIASVGMCSPRSILPMCERSMPARFASDSCAIPRSVRNARTAAPKACASSASKVVAPAGRPRWMDRFCIDRSVKSQHNQNHVIFNSISPPTLVCSFTEIRFLGFRQTRRIAFVPFLTSPIALPGFYASAGSWACAFTSIRRSEDAVRRHWTATTGLRP